MSLKCGLQEKCGNSKWYQCNKNLAWGTSGDCIAPAPFWADHRGLDKVNFWDGKDCQVFEEREKCEDCNGL